MAWTEERSQGCSPRELPRHTGLRWSIWTLPHNVQMLHLSSGHICQYIPSWVVESSYRQYPLSKTKSDNIEFELFTIACSTIFSNIRKSLRLRHYSTVFPNFSPNIDIIIFLRRILQQQYLCKLGILHFFPMAPNSKYSSTFFFKCLVFHRLLLLFWISNQESFFYCTICSLGSIQCRMFPR